MCVWGGGRGSLKDEMEKSERDNRELEVMESVTEMMGWKKDTVQRKKCA